MRKDVVARNLTERTVGIVLLTAAIACGIAAGPASSAADHPTSATSITASVPDTTAWE